MLPVIGKALGLAIHHKRGPDTEGGLWTGQCLNGEQLKGQVPGHKGCSDSNFCSKVKGLRGNMIL